MKTKAALMFVVIVLATAQLGFAQLFGGGADKASTELVPGSVFVGASMFPKKIVEDPNFKAFPREVVSAWGQKELGFDPMLIGEGTWMRKVPENVGQGKPIWAAVMHFEEMQGVAGQLIDRLEEKRIAGKTVFSGVNEGVPSFMIFDESTIVVGEEELFEEMVTATGDGSIVGLMKEGNVVGQVYGFVDVEAIRPLIAELFDGRQFPELPVELEDLKKVPELVDSIEVGLDTKNKIETKIVMHAIGEDSAKELSEIILATMEYGKQAMVGQMSSSMNMQDPVQVATIQYTNRVWEKFIEKWTPEVNGSDVTITMQEEVLALPFLSSLGFTSYARSEQMQYTPENQLRVAALAIHNYESAYQKFPSRVITNDQGEVLFSGRVSILPFIEQANLYNSLKLDEPWDSEHNAQFTSMAIPAYSNISSGGVDSNVRFPVFPDGIWSETGDTKTFAEITDGTSNTILTVFVDDSQAINWADPSPFSISPSNPMKDVFGDREQVLVGMADG